MTSNKERLLSLDTLRGFDMFWIIGGDLLFRTLGEHTSWPWAKAWAVQMDHVPWQGFHAYDLVFPLFMFIAGVAIPFALLGKKEKGVSGKSLYKKVISRALVLFLLGLVYNDLLAFNFKELRVASVLGQIGFAYLIAAIIVLNTKTIWHRLAWFGGIVTAYAAVQLWVPVPGFGAGQFTPQGSVNSFIDGLLLPGQMYGGTFDPEGILCIVSASAITLLGALAGDVLKNKAYSGKLKTYILAGSGLGFVFIALGLNNFYPFIKALWTSSFNLLAGGISLILLALFYLLIDVWKFQKWTFFFRVIGLNSITIYMLTRIVDFYGPASFFFEGVGSLFGNLQLAMVAAGMIALEWLVLYFLYKKQIFIKV